MEREERRAKIESWAAPVVREWDVDEDLPSRLSESGQTGRRRARGLRERNSPKSERQDGIKEERVLTGTQYCREVKENKDWGKVIEFGS